MFGSIGDIPLADAEANYYQETGEFAMAKQLTPTGIPGFRGGSILVAAQVGRPVDPTWWDRLIAKLEHQPITPDTTHAMFGLLGNRLKGVALDDDRLVDAFLAMFNRVRLPLYSYAQFGDYLLKHVGDEPLADQVFELAVVESLSNPHELGIRVDVGLPDRKSGGGELPTLPVTN